jgi:hypothetical protein
VGDEYTKNLWSPGGEYKVKSMMNKCNSNIRPGLENKFLDMFKEIGRGEDVGVKKTESKIS